MLCSQALALNAEPELRAEDAYEWTQGRVVFADRKRRDPTSSTIKLASGQEFQPSAQLGSSCTKQCLLAHMHCCLLEKAGALRLKIHELSLCAGCVETAYLFPGIGLGCIVSRANRLRDEGFVAAAEALAKCVTDGVHLTRCRLATLLC